jgi:hypothetical protein
MAKRQAWQSPKAKDGAPFFGQLLKPSADMVYPTISVRGARQHAWEGAMRHGKSSLFRRKTPDGRRSRSMFRRGIALRFTVNATAGNGTRCKNRTHVSWFGGRRSTIELNERDVKRQFTMAPDSRIELLYAAPQTAVLPLN